MPRSTTLPPSAWEKWEREGKPRQFRWRGSVVVPMPWMFDEENQDKPAADVAKQKETELEKLQTKVLALWDKDKSNARVLGETLVAIRDLMPYGEFSKWWKKEKLDQNRVSYCMRLVEGKVAEAKEKVKRSDRTKALLTITKKLRKLYDLAMGGDIQRAKELLKEIDHDIEERFFEKPKSMAASNAG